jgi:hypothetical protein
VIAVWYSRWDPLRVAALLDLVADVLRSIARTLRNEM